MVNDMKIDEPPVVKKFTKKFQVESLTCAAWFRNNYIITENNNDRIPRMDLYQNFLASLTEYGRGKAITRNQFYNELRSLLREKVVHGKRYFVSAKLRKVV